MDALDTKTQDDAGEIGKPRFVVGGVGDCVYGRLSVECGTDDLGGEQIAA